MLSDYRVLDLTGELGWLTGRLLADMGAEVVKIEAPDAAIGGTDWQAYNINKRLLMLDLAVEAGQKAFDRLVAKADFLLECAAPGSRQANGLLDPDRLHALNPELIHVSITPFGRTGPRADWQGSDMELMAAGGAMSLAGEPDGIPVRVTAPQAHAWAGASGSVGAMAALAYRATSGMGQHVDVSAQASVIAALANAPAFFDLDGVTPSRDGAFITGRSIKGARFRVFWPCRDGHVNFILYGGAAGRRTNAGLISWMNESGADLGVLAEIDWENFDPTQKSQEEVDAFEKPIGRFIATLGKREFLEGTFQREMLGYPVSTVADIASDPQLEAREFWQTMPGPDGREARHTGCIAIVDGKRPPLRYPIPKTGEHSREVLEEGGFSPDEIDSLVAANVVRQA